MHRIVITCAGAATVFMATAFAPPLARAMPISAPMGLAEVAVAATPMQPVGYVCAWWGGRCWTVGYGYYYRPYYTYGTYPYYRLYHRPYGY